MASETTTQGGTAWAPDVLALAVEHKVDRYLPTILEMTRQVFPTARRIEVLLEEDPEIADDRRIVFEVDVPLPVTAAVETANHWYRGLFRCCPSSQVWVFRLGMQLVS